jgi:hypothetical protein
MTDAVSTFLADKLDEYQVLVAPLERAHREIDLSHQLLRARLESEISERVPALGLLAQILDFSIINLLVAQDRAQFVNQAIMESGLTSEEVLRELKSLGPPPPHEDLALLGLTTQSG